MIENLTVIKGGRDIPKENNGRRFIEGFVTATRLMGVMGMELVWDVLVDSKIETLHQIFYLDSEEYGIETFMHAYGIEPKEIVAERNRLVGALGGAVISISEKEARFLLQTHTAIGAAHNRNLPDGREKFAYLLEPIQELSKDEYLQLMQKVCGNINSEYFIINYFIMRAVAGDERAAAYLLADKSFYPSTLTPDTVPAFPNFKDFQFGNAATLYRNNIKFDENDSSNSYICESLIEAENQYRLIVSEIELQKNPLVILNARHCSDLRISSTEASMLMDRSEFITVFDILNANEAMLDAFNDYIENFTETQYENGTLYIDFNSTNDHVNNPLYRINDDIHVMYFMTLSNQILIVGYTHDAVYEAEFRLSLALMPYTTVINMKYEFKEPIIYEFMQSDFDDFESFVDYLGGHPEE